MTLPDPEDRLDWLRPWARPLYLRRWLWWPFLVLIGPLVVLFHVMLGALEGAEEGWDEWMDLR